MTGDPQNPNAPGVSEVRERARVTSCPANLESHARGAAVETTCRALDGHPECDEPIGGSADGEIEPWVPGEVQRETEVFRTARHEGLHIDRGQSLPTRPGVSRREKLRPQHDPDRLDGEGGAGDVRRSEQQVPNFPRAIIEPATQGVGPDFVSGDEGRMHFPTTGTRLLYGPGKIGCRLAREVDGDLPPCGDPEADFDGLEKIVILQSGRPLRVKDRDGGDGPAGEHPSLHPKSGDSGTGDHGVPPDVVPGACRDGPVEPPLRRRPG